MTVGIVDHPGGDRDSLRCRETPRAAPRLIRAWRRRSWSAPSCRPLKPLLATEACQGPTEGADFGPGVLRLLAGWVLMDTARVLCKGRLTREAMLFTWTHDWQCLDSDL